MREPFRQVHLDFHTSERITGVGSRFSKAQFQEALKLGNVNLINVFAKCHHGWSYYPTKVGQPHPHLACDLLGEQLQACHEIAVKAPIYYTMGWSATDAEQHPEWCMRNADGSISAVHYDLQARPDDAKPRCSWKNLCPSGGYHALMLAQTEEICRMYPVDGFWYDIYELDIPCYCETCKKGMHDQGLNPESQADAMQFRAYTIHKHIQELKSVILALHPDASIYFNGLTVLNRPANYKYPTYELNTKNDLEDLPTTWGGYDKFPLRSRFFLKEGKPIVAMSGKFHTDWGEFGGFKHPNALCYEAAAMIAFGARCSFGDQLHPCGEMDLETYRNIGQAYNYIEQIEQFGADAQAMASLGVWISRSLPADEGTTRMLLEEQIDFDVVRAAEDFARYEAIILPSATQLEQNEAEKLTSYSREDGKLLILNEAALDKEKGAFSLPIGAKYLGPRAFDIDYTVVTDAVVSEMVRSPFLNYEAALRINPEPGVSVLASINEPYFSRTYGKYCGHQNTPYRLEAAAHPAVIRNGNIIYCAHALDKIYYQHGMRLHRQLFANLVRLLHEQPRLEADLPSAARVSLMHQPKQRRYIAHLLYAPALQRGRCSVIEDLVPLSNVSVKLRLPEKIRRITLIPEQRQLEFRQEPAALMVTIPQFRCHCALVCEY